MRTLFQTFMAVIFTTALFSSCGSKNELAKSIPSDAIVVMHFNTGSLLEKLPWSEVKSTAWFQAMAADTSAPDWAKKLLENPEATGINMEKGIVFFIANNADNKLFFVVQGSLESTEEFLQFNKSLEGGAVVETDGMNTIVLNGKAVACWKGNDFMYIAGGFDPDEVSPREVLRGNDIEPGRVDALTGYCSQLFSLPADSSLAGDERFASLIAEKGDAHAWFNLESAMNMSPQMGMLGMLKLDDLIHGTRSGYTATFENDAIVVDHKYYASEKMLELIKKYKGSEVNATMIHNIPSKDITGLLTLNFKPQGLEEIMKLIGVDGFINMALGSAGITLEIIANAMNGDLVISVSDLKVSSDSMSTDPDLNFLISMGIGNKESFQKVQDALHKLLPEMGREKIYMDKNDEIFAFGNDSSFVKTFLSGSQKNTPEFSKEFEGHPFGFFLDLQKILTVVEQETHDSLKEAAVQKSLNFWDEIISTGGGINNNAFTSTTEIRLMNKEPNSLRQLNQYINALYLIEEAREDKMENSLPDSLLMPPPVDTVTIP